MSISEDKLFASEVVPYKILVLCIGNTCRSVVYESLFNKINKKPNMKIYSAGIRASGKKPSKKTLKVLLINKIPVNKNKISTKIEELKDNRYDEVILLDNTIVFNSLDLIAKKVKRYNLEDPYAKNLKAYKKTYKEIKKILINV